MYPAGVDERAKYKMPSSSEPAPVIHPSIHPSIYPSIIVLLGLFLLRAR
jgi:hypothetical protein